MAPKPKFLKEAGNVHLAYYLEAADQLGIPYQIISYRLMARFQYQDKHWFIVNTVLPINNTPGTTIAKRKFLTNRVLAQAGISVPVQKNLRSADEAVEFFHTYHDIVIKPAQALGGHGISILPKSDEEVRMAFERAVRSNHPGGDVQVLGEIFAKGDNYRLLVLDDKVIAAARRMPACVTGNGIDTIMQLLIPVNQERVTKALHEISIDSESIAKLAQQGMTVDSVPEIGRTVSLRFNSNLTTGGTSEECLDSVDEFYKQIAVDAVKAIGLTCAGVDMIAPEITKTGGEYVINEINHNPGLQLHAKVSKGKAINIAVPIMEFIRDNYK